MDSLHSRRCGEVLACRYGDLVELFLSEQAEQPILSADGDDITFCAVDHRVESRADLAQISIVHIMRNKLAVPEKPALRLSDILGAGAEV
jgi:hypothetical protein